MIESTVKLANGLACGVCQVMEAFDAALGRALGPERERGGSSELSEEELERIRQSVVRLERDLRELADSDLLGSVSQLLDEAFGGPDELVEVVASWAELIDSLVQAAEVQIGSASGRGPWKRRQVKGALLYLAQGTRVNLPSVPSPLEPVVWNLALNPAVDAIVRFSNRHQLWVEAPEKPSLRGRLNVGAHRAGSLFEALTLWATRIVWRFVIRCSPVSPPLKKTVDDFLLRNPQPLRTVVLLLSWIVDNTRDLVVLTDLLSVVVLEAQFVAEGDEQRRKIYARELLFAFLEESVDLPPRGSLAFRLLSSVVDVGIGIAVRLFHKRTHRAFVGPKASQ